MRPIFALAALLTASTATSGTAVAQTDSSQPDWIEQARILAQMEGTTVGEQVRRYSLHRKAIKMDQRFREDPDYAGAQVERKGPTFKVTFAFRGGGQQRKIDDPELAGVSTFTSAAHSLREIHQERQRLTRLLRERGLSAAFTVRYQQLEVYPDDPARVRALVSDGTIVLPPFVTLKEGPIIRVDEANVEGAGLMTGSGVNPLTGLFENYRCVGGFSVTNGTIDGLATGGHCDHKPGELKTHRGVAVGERKGYEWRRNGLDVSWHHKPGDIYLPRVRTSSTSYYSIREVSPTEVPYPTPVCVVLKDDSQHCAYVWGSTWYGDDGPYVVMDRDGAVKGDSGGPWFYGNTAFGIHQGNYTHPTTGVLYDQYTPAESLPRMGIRVKLAQ